MNNSFIIDFVSVSCPKCGFSIFQEAIDKVNNIACQKCGHSFDWRKRRTDEIIQRFKKPFTLGDSKDVALSRDVYVSGEFNGVSVADRGMPGSVRVGRISGDPFDNVVRDHNGFVQGTITSSGNFTSHRI